MVRINGLLAVAAVALSGCAALADRSLRATARDDFVRQATCPADRVTVVHAPPAPAPPEIAADPGRLAIWSSEQERRARYHLVARGCGEERRYLCGLRSEGLSSWAECTLESPGLGRLLTP